MQTLPIAQDTPVRTDSFSRGYDPYTHACEARTLSTDGWTSLSVIVIVTTHGSAELRWSIADSDETDFTPDHCEVKYCEVNGEQDDKQIDWTSIEADVTQEDAGPDGWICLTSVTGLQEATNNVFKGRAVWNMSRPRPRSGSVMNYNLLLWGSTGVGKTTFINAFVNYVAYDTLDEAREGGLKHVLPARLHSEPWRDIHSGDRWVRVPDW